jgi:Di- and tricarboxylate transporters
MTPERRAFLLRAAPPLLVGGVIALLPVPEGLKPQAWYYFALFAAVIVGVATEPIPPGAIGLAGVVIAAMSGLVFKNPTQAVNWALSGSASPPSGSSSEPTCSRWDMRRRVWASASRSC